MSNVTRMMLDEDRKWCEGPVACDASPGSPQHRCYAGLPVVSDKRPRHRDDHEDHDVIPSIAEILARFDVEDKATPPSQSASAEEKTALPASATPNDQPKDMPKDKPTSSWSRLLSQDATGAIEPVSAEALMMERYGAEFEDSSNSLLRRPPPCRAQQRPAPNERRPGPVLAQNERPRKTPFFPSSGGSICGAFDDPGANDFGEGELLSGPAAMAALLSAPRKGSGKGRKGGSVKRRRRGGRASQFTPRPFKARSLADISESDEEEEDDEEEDDEEEMVEEDGWGCGEQEDDDPMRQLQSSHAQEAFLSKVDCQRSVWKRQRQ